METNHSRGLGPEAMDYLCIRHQIYDLLRRLFIEEPTPELLSLVQKGGKGVRTDFPCGLEHAVQGSLDRIIGALSGRSLSACDSDYEDIHWDFTRLFIGPQAPVAPPWESCYVGEGLLFQECTRSVEEYYRAHGFRLKGCEFEAADHVGFELDFIFALSGAVLQTATLSALAQSDAEPVLIDAGLLIGSADSQLDFIRRHLMVFVDQFGQKISRHASTQYYKEIGTFLPMFIQYDESRLSCLVQDLEVCLAS